MTLSTPALPSIQRSPLLQGLALVFGGVGLAVVRHWPLAATAAFAAGGLCLALARKGQGEVIDDQLPAPASRQGWEPWFLAALLGLGLLTFGWKLNSIPEGANYSEGYLAVRSAAIAASATYIAHDDSEVPWPTLYHYLGAAEIKYFGNSPGSYRLVSVFFGLLVLAAVYFSVRILSSAPTAAVTSLLWLAFHFNMHFARRYCPIIFLYLPPFVGLAAVLLGLRTGRWWWWAAAGFMIGLAMHGYLPGRVVPVVFVAFSAWLWLNRAKFGLQLAPLVLMWAVSFVVAYPILKYIVTRPVEYNAILKQDSVINTQSLHGVKLLLPFIKTFPALVEPYLLMFHVRGNSEYEEDDTYSRPVLDPVMGLLFPLGFFFCFLRFRRTVPFYLMALFWIGLIPGIYSKKGLAPFPRREVIAFPAVFMMAALVLEELRLGLFKVLTVRRWITAWCLIGAVLLVRQWRHYWIYTHSPGFRRFSCATCYFMGNELREHAASARAVVSLSLQQGSPSKSILTPPYVPVQEVPRAENFIFLDPGQDVLLLLAPYLEALIPTLKRVYPNADAKLYREPAYDDQAFLQQQMRDTIFSAFCPDTTNPALLLARVLIPAADLDARAGWLDLKGGSTLKNSDPKAFQDHAGQVLHIGATVPVDTVGNSLMLRLAWPGWRLKVDGKAMPMNKPFFARGNFRFVELEGTVPKGFQGPFPGQVLAGPGLGRLNTLAWRFDQGLNVAFMRGFKPDLDRKEDYNATLLDPILRWGEDYKLVDYPGQIRITAKFTPPSTGEWHLRLRWPGSDGGVIHLGSALAVQGAIGGPDTEVAGVLQAGVPVPLRVDYPMNLAMAYVTAFLLEAKGPGESAWHWIDARSLRPQ
jgi:hypothetical protein